MQHKFGKLPAVMKGIAMRFIKSSLIVAGALSSLGASAAFAQPDPAGIPGAENGECVVVPGYKGRWFLKEGQWHRCRKSGAGLWVPAGGAGLAAAGAAGGAGVIAAGVGVAAAAGIGIAASGGNDGPASP